MRKTTQKITLSAMFIAIGIVLPIFSGQIRQIGSMLLFMWTYMWMAVWCGSGLYLTITAFIFIWYAANVSHGSSHVL